MSKLMIALLASAGLLVAGPIAAQTQKITVTPISKDAYAAATKDADAQHKVDRDACGSLSANAKDICLAEAKGKELVAKADAKAAHEATPKNREAARVARAQASYEVAKEKCDDLAGNPKDVCNKEAEAGLVKGKADAKVDRVAAVTRNEGEAKRAEAREDASAAKRDADLKVAIEKCDALAGAVKESCVADAKARFGKA